jgi:Cof subfamily protein (haloacid dehalogenase superfamily)
MLPLEECGVTRHTSGMKNRVNAYRLAFVDLDDTLLGPDKTISPANLAAIHRLRANGVHVAVASGRHHKNITAMDEIGEQTWVLSSHGSVVRHEQTGEILLEMTMDPRLVAQVCDKARELGLSLIAYHRDGAFIEQATKWTDLYARNSGWAPQVMKLRDLPAAGFQKLLWSDEPERIQNLAPAIQAEFAGRLNVMVTNPELLEFLSSTANKAVGAQALTGKLGIRAEETLAFGDGNNDVELLRWAGVSVAMNHGRASARQAARFVSPVGVPEEAFARAVEVALGEMGGS